MVSYSEFVKLVKEAVRAKAKDIPRFETKEGCIRISCLPECKEAFEWMGGVGEFNRDDAPFVEDAYPIFPGGTFIARFYDNPDGSVDTVNTYAITAMKIAQLSYLHTIRDFSSGPEFEYLKCENGFAPWAGVLCCCVFDDFRSPGCNYGSDAMPGFCRVYVAVSGASEAEDLECVVAAINTIQNFFKENGEFVVRPLIASLSCTETE